MPRVCFTLALQESCLADGRTLVIYGYHAFRDRNFFKSAGCTVASILAHTGLVWFAVGVAAGSRQIPTNEREARVFFLLPPDRVDVRSRQTEIIQWGKPGGDLEDGMHLLNPSEGWLSRLPAHGARNRGDRSGARGELPFGPPATFVPDTAFSVLEVDEIVRYEGSSAPIYPRDLLAIGAEGLVQAIYLVDTAGMVDTTTIQVVRSDDPRFTESVRTALAHMRFRPATRSGKKVRQLVEQKFRFRVTPPSQVTGQVS